MNQLAFEAAYNVNKRALENVVKHTENAVMITAVEKKKNENKRKNTATEVLKKTLGQHEALKSHEEAVQKKIKEKQEKAQKKKEEANERKRKRIEEKEEREKTKRKKKEEKVEKEKEKLLKKCQFPSCKYNWRGNLKKSERWFACKCNSFYLCPSHSLFDKLEKSKSLFENHKKVCSPTLQ